MPKIVGHFNIKQVHVVPVPNNSSEEEWLERVAQHTAYYLNSIFDSKMVLGIAWGTTLSAISRHLLPKTLHDAQIVQLNGAGNTQTMGIEYASEIIMHFAQKFPGCRPFFPSPLFLISQKPRKPFGKRAVLNESWISKNAPTCYYSALVQSMPASPAMFTVAAIWKKAIMRNWRRSTSPAISRRSSLERTAVLAVFQLMTGPVGQTWNFSNRNMGLVLFPGWQKLKVFIPL